MRRPEVRDPPLLVKPDREIAVRAGTGDRE
jgi:hypothetical protein